MGKIIETVRDLPEVRTSFVFGAEPKTMVIATNNLEPHSQLFDLLPLDAGLTCGGNIAFKGGRLRIFREGGGSLKIDFRNYDPDPAVSYLKSLSDGKTISEVNIF